MYPIKQFNSQEELEHYIETELSDVEQPYLYINKENGSITMGIKNPIRMVDCLLISCIGEEQDMREDPDGYYQFSGEWEYEGETYYKWVKISNSGWPNSVGRIGLTSKRTFENASIDNPEYFEGWLIADSINPSYSQDDIIGFEKKVEVDAKPLDYHDTSKMDKNGYEYVDLGLPSGVLWAKYNIGAGSEEEYGKYFQWGDTMGYIGQDALDHSYWSTCPFNNGSENYDEEYFLANKSQWLTANDELKPEYDAAHINMGGDWKMPSIELITELLRYTTSEYVQDYKGTGVNGRLFTGRNGNTLFIPFSGCVSDGSFYGVGNWSQSWSSRLSIFNPDSSCYLSCIPGSIGMNGGGRYYGLAVRGVVW